PMADFGVHGFPADLNPSDPLERYREVLEVLPPQFSTVWISDHMQFGHEATVEGWTTLTYLAALFPRYTYGHLVLSQSYRNPALLAKMAATLQLFSGGRYILGMGAGWHEEEYRSFGFEYPRSGVRVAQLGEAIEIMRTMWTTTPATFHGEHYSIDDAFCVPRPDPRIPILVGTNGPKALAIAARLADMWCWDGPLDDTYLRPLEILRGHCKAIGRPFDEITLTSELTIELPDDPSKFEPTFTHPFYGDAVVFRLLGPRPTDVIQDIERLVDVGVRHLILNFNDMTTFTRFLADVVPHVRLETRK
ncbi:MAG: LLM class flavin-dependent oxidoreductase, partial [Chloroflexota bacterium]